ncbi:MAG: TlpA family protein disulfide reductase [Tannerella sp.]|jgi:thiol-disulfide isomerase/thioredoxin|nr:TlpA family protein disulfide reductase [Tannerella sp.]
MKFIYSFIIVYGSLISLKAQTYDSLTVPHIQAGIATLTGKMTEECNAQVKNISLSIGNPITAERRDYEIPIQDNGCFSHSIPVACVSIGEIISDIYTGTIPLTPGEETILEVVCDSDGTTQIQIESSLSQNLTVFDMMNLGNTMMGILRQRLRPYNYEMTPQEFSHYTVDRMEVILKTLDTVPNISDAAKQLVRINAELIFLDYLLRDYNAVMKLLYKEQHKTDSIPPNFYIPKPDKSYYSVIKHFNLNDSLYLYASSYPIILQFLLEDETLNIPSIGETSIFDWIIKVKRILEDDFSPGIFYDLLVANSYTKQLTGMNPLTEIQKQNIQSYYKNKSFIELLMNENDRVLQLNAKSSESVLSASANIMDSVVLKYKGKVVFVDLWATWCGPCLEAMTGSKQIKEEFEQKDVVFVYITDISSPQLVWEQKISDIKGDHYRLSLSEFNKLLDDFGFSHIPSYLIFNKDGILKYKNTPFMGVEKMKMWLNELVQE